MIFSFFFGQNCLNLELSIFVVHEILKEHLEEAQSFSEFSKTEVINLKKTLP